MVSRSHGRDIGIFIILGIFASFANASTQSTVEHGNFLLKVTTFNIKGLPRPIGIAPKKIVGIGKTLKKWRTNGEAPHIIAIQEGFVDAAQKLIKESGYPYVVQGPKEKFLKMSSGLWILSEFPLTERSLIVYRHCASWDCFGRKGAVHVSVEIPGVPVKLDLFNTHTNADVNTDPITPIEKSFRARLRQIEALKAFITDNRSPLRPLLSVGDFNFMPFNPDYLLFTRYSDSLENAAATCLQDPQCMPDTDLDAYFVTTVDHEFYESARFSDISIRPVDIKRMFTKPMVSDHEALQVTYEMAW